MFDCTFLIFFLRPFGHLKRREIFCSVLWANVLTHTEGAKRVKKGVCERFLFRILSLSLSLSNVVGRR